ncbi:MAG: CoA transferase [Pseudomonadota bacterium]
MTDGAHRAPLADLLGALDLGAVSRAQIEPAPPLLPTPHQIQPLATAAFAALGEAAARLAEHRGAGAPDVSVSARAAELGMMACDLLQIDGQPVSGWDPVTGAYETAVGWVYVHANFPHHRDGFLSLVGAPPEKAAIQTALRARSAAEWENEAQRHGLLIIRVRSRDDWRRDADTVASEALPVLRVEPAATGAPGPLPVGATAAKPLAGLRVLDLSRVIAGPMAGRHLAGLGAEVLRIGGAHLPVAHPLPVDTGWGKHSASLDLRREEDRRQLAVLVREAHVVIDGYRPGALGSRGFGEAAWFEINPRLVLCDLSAFSPVGTWAGRRGFDSYIQYGAGFGVMAESGPPTRLPCQPLDYLSGVFGALGAVAGLLRGGGQVARYSLEQTALWIWGWSDALGPLGIVPSVKPGPREASPWMRTAPGPLGRVGSLGSALSLQGVEAMPVDPPRPIGGDAPRWGLSER